MREVIPEFHVHTETTGMCKLEKLPSNIAHDKGLQMIYYMILFHSPTVRYYYKILNMKNDPTNSHPIQPKQKNLGHLRHSFGKNLAKEYKKLVQSYLPQQI